MKKAHYYSRGELYELVWSEPRTHLAKRIGISDVAIGKACRKSGIPMPPAGHWARKKTSKPVSKMPLPPRDPGVDDEIKLGGSRYDYGWHHSDKEINELTPRPPVFSEPFDDVRQRIKKRIGKVAQPRVLRDPHRLISQLLEQDDERREKAANSSYVYSWDEPKFDSSIEKRRLRILSGLFRAVGKCGAKSGLNKEAREISVKVGDQHVQVTLELIEKSGRSKAKQTKPRDRLRLTVGGTWRSKNEDQRVWEDSGEHKLESMLRDIAEEVILAGERQYREGKEHHYEWLIERKRDLEEKERERIETEKRLERERLERIRQERIQRLLDEASAHRQACDIRMYIDQVLAAVDESSLQQSQEELMSWAQWARAQADDLEESSHNCLHGLHWLVMSYVPSGS